jgi:hypothetical protein
MEMQAAKRMFYLAVSRINKLSVRKKGASDLRLLHPEVVEISPTSCFFERPGNQDFQVGEEIDFLFDTEDSCLSAGAAIVWVTKFEFLDEAYEHDIWFSYGAEFSSELDGEFFQRIKGDPKKAIL